jgi:hypothetical protein
VFSRLLYININIEIYETITLSVVLYGCCFRKKEVECVENVAEEYLDPRGVE